MDTATCIHANSRGWYPCPHRPSTAAGNTTVGLTPLLPLQVACTASRCSETPCAGVLGVPQTGKQPIVFLWCQLFIALAQIRIAYDHGCMRIHFLTLHFSLMQAPRQLQQRYRFIFPGQQRQAEQQQEASEQVG